LIFLAICGLSIFGRFAVRKLMFESIAFVFVKSWQSFNKRGSVKQHGQFLRFICKSNLK